MAPFDPLQLLNALDSFLSPNGGIRCPEDVPRLVSLMKKFSKKLVSRCIYCNVLQATPSEILSEYLDKGGWETIYTWLQDARDSGSHSLLVEMLNLCKLLPMTLERLKENGTAKIIKSLTKSENSDIKQLSHDVVSNWMTLIKLSKPVEITKVKKKKKKEKEKEGKKSKEEKKEKVEKKEKEEKKEKVEKKVEKEKPEKLKKASAKTEEKLSPPPTPEPPKRPVKLKPTKRPSSERLNKEYYEDVKIDLEPLVPVSKKPKTDRPKTAKIYQKKFRATGLLEETPLPKNIAKKSTPVDKTAAVAAAKNVLKLNTSATERIVEKKIKPESLMVINETTTNKGVRLIPAKPKPIHVLTESTSFMDALTSQPVLQQVKRKKKLAKTPNSPTSPVIAAPKLEFYKDTLEMNEEKSKKEENDKENSFTEGEEENVKEESATSEAGKADVMDVAADEGGGTPPFGDAEIPADPTEPMQVDDESADSPKNTDPNALRSILSHGRRRGKKKNVRWIEDENIKEIFYFEMDENERVNVIKLQNLGDIKNIDSRREREAFEQAKRHSGDKMEEGTRFWTVPILIDIPYSPPVQHGCNSIEKDIESVRQQSTLTEIYFTKEMIPDSPHEPDFEIIPSQEPKVVNLDEDNQIGAIMDFSNYEMPKPILPDVISNVLLKLNNDRQDSQPLLAAPDMMPFNNGMINQNGPLPDMNQQNLSAPYDPGEPLHGMQHNPTIMSPDPMQNMYSPPRHENMPLPNDWRGRDGMLPQEQQQQFFGGFNGPPMNNGPPLNNGPPPFNSHMMPPEPNMNMNMRPHMMNDSFRPNNSYRGFRHQGPRHRGGFPKIPCRHFRMGNCRFEMNCTFLHPGINGPRL